MPKKDFYKLNARIGIEKDNENKSDGIDYINKSKKENIMVEAEIDEIVSSIKSEEDLEIKVENSTSNSSTEEFVLDQIKD